MTDSQRAKMIVLTAYMALRALWFFPYMALRALWFVPGMMLRQMQWERRER
jgi:hypothetical protein